VGWKVLVVAHNPRTILKYEEILGIKLRELFPAVGPSARRSQGFSLVSGLKDFWSGVNGKVHVPGRTLFSD
jgi:hypothetical protein